MYYKLFVKTKGSSGESKWWESAGNMWVFTSKSYAEEYAQNLCRLAAAQETEMAWELRESETFPPEDDRDTVTFHYTQ